MDLSEPDRRLLRLLQQDSRISNQELAEHTGLSASVCWRRVKALQEAGVIAAYPVVLDAEKAGLNFAAIVHVTLARHGTAAVAAFIKRVSERPEVLDCFATSGEADYHLRVLCRDRDAYNLFLEEVLFRLPGIAHVRTNLVLKVIKLQTQIPI
ncbi:MAG: Lrp/AsnC family transcriptional regulator [Rhodospirillaceae bacterium]|nr:Lrp/AsnC family transcriptional regulator [Rhodospirillaceae bacterium]